MDGSPEGPNQQLSAVARAWVSWPRRFSLGGAGHPEHAPQAVWDEFGTHVLSRNPHLRAVDLVDSIGQFKSDCATLLGVYQAVLNGIVGDLVFDDYQPLLLGDPAANSLSSWLEITSDVDPDALIALHATTCGYDIRLADMTQWAVNVISGDRDLLRLARKGLVDMHLHLGGTRFVPLHWDRLMTLPSRMGETLQASIGPQRFREDRVDGAMVNAARRIVRGECCGDCFFQSSCRECAHRDRDFGEPALLPSDVPREELPQARYPLMSAQLLEERTFLVNAWRQLRELPRLQTQLLAQRLDTYLAIKGRFRQQHIQPSVGGSAGLEEFDKYLNATRHFPKPGGTRVDKGRWLHQSGLVLRLLREHPSLARVELRIAPERQVVNYVGAVRTFNKMLTEIDKTRIDKAPAGGVGRDQRGSEPTEMALAVHFIRTRQRVGEPRDGKDSYLSKRIEADACSAALHAYRFRYVEEAKSIVRIDVAGQERHSSSQIFAPYFLLLRGDELALSKLESGALDEDRFAHWYRLRDQGRHRSRFGASRLGFTVHAGEDYFLPLDGLYEVAMAVERFRMQPGDAIGHALAVGASAEHFETLVRRRPLIPAGVEFESLLWLHRVLGEEGDNDPIMGPLEACLRQKARELTKRPFEPVELYPLVSAANTAPPKQRPADQLTSATEEFLQARFFDEQTRQQYFKQAPAHEIHQRLGGAFAKAQRSVVKLLLERGVVVETNPSSNCRVLGGIAPKDLPIFKMLALSEGKLRVTIGSDDPAVFDSWIGNEYALLFEGYLGCFGASERQQGLDLLEKLRTQGLDHVNWG